MSIITSYLCDRCGNKIKSVYCRLNISCQYSNNKSVQKDLCEKCYLELARLLGLDRDETLVDDAIDHIQSDIPF